MIFNFCPTWAEVEFWTSNQLGWQSVFYSRQVVGKLILKILSNLGRIIFLQFFIEAVLKIPFSSATTGRVFSEITPQNANPIGYHLEKHFENYNRSTNKKFSFGGYHLRRTMDKKRFSPATTWESDNQAFM